MRRTVTSITVGTVLWSTCASIPRSQCKGQTVPSEENVKAIHKIVSSTEHHIQSAYSADREGFYVIYDSRTRNPICAVEKLTKFDKSAPKESKRPPFFAESSIAQPFRVHPKDYNDSCYDRGHMAPAADFSSDSELFEKTFSMTNISPQSPVLNQGFWSRFENWIRYFLLKFIFDEAVVITGPVFAPVFIDNKWVFVHRTVGTFPNLVHVPSHFFKVIIGKKNGSPSSIVGAFLVPNNQSVQKTDPVMNYLVKLSQLEALVGFRFMPSILDEKERDKLDIFVSDKRDLSYVLNAKNVMHQSKALAWAEIGDPRNAETVKLADESGKYSALSKRSVQSSQRFLHLCEFGVDCSRSMF